MRDQFDISGVFETTEFEIAQVACSSTFRCKWFSCFKSGIKETGVDFRSNLPAMELCSIQNCEKLDDSAENISKKDSGSCITTY